MKKSEYEGITLSLSKNKRLMVKIESKTDKKQAIVIWTDNKGNLKFMESEQLVEDVKE